MVVHRRDQHLPWRGLLHPDMMCLTKAGKEGEVSTALGTLSSFVPSHPLNLCPLPCYWLTSNLPGL